MAKSPLILAALAASAAPGKNFLKVQSTSDETPGFDSTLLTEASGEHFWLLSPSDPSSLLELKTELSAIEIFSKFELFDANIPNVVGETLDSDKNRVLLMSYVYGNPIKIGTAKAKASLDELGKTLAHLHNQDTAEAREQELVEFSPQELIATRVAELDEVASTGKVPSVLLTRWEKAFEDIGLFRFHPTLIHGNVNGETVVFAERIGFKTLSSVKISDPAEDISWVMAGALHENIESFRTHYSTVRVAADENLFKRATLYSEIELARWLMVCLTEQNQVDVDSAIADLEDLAAEAQKGSLPILEATSFIGLGSLGASE